MRALIIAICALAANIAGAEESPQSIADVHAKIISPASDALFNAESKPPKSDAQWSALEKNAAALAKSAQALTAKPNAKDQKNWMLFAKSLRTEAHSAEIAARQRDLNELVAANGRIVAICESCHDEYRDHGHGMTSDKTRK